MSPRFDFKTFSGDADPAELAAVLALREAVFVVEQSVPVDEEIDGLDGAARHVSLRLDGDVVGTARLRVVDGVAKIERVAVDRSRRGHGLGRRVMGAIEAAAAEVGCAHARLAAQLRVLEFYEGLGYVAEGDVFLDAGIEHRWMSKPL